MDLGAVQWSRTQGKFQESCRRQRASRGTYPTAPTRRSQVCHAGLIERRHNGAQALQFAHGCAIPVHVAHGAALTGQAAAAGRDYGKGDAHLIGGGLEIL